MVPNHMGIDSPWLIEHPDWFLHRWESPFPAYSFNGPDLSSDSRVEIKIDDRYYDQSDAAVAFRLRHYANGETRYVYHGNDGTSFAWNDTAQLDYSKAEVREHVIQTILHVARLFPIIRFDAAMVLAKRHVQRLWFPLPGAGGSIPSRAENAMSQEEFDALMPNEFWREVVDRVAAEVPGTLLLAEAFWLLEGYFVRTLGMHRVYNSAFMNMLRDEENAKYRSYLKKTIEFDPDIMKRYVNFMSNPDERTAIDQFGTGDKYFGVCTLLATLPGLPMFAHGQIEGFTERYGMEFKQAMLDEWPNEGLVARHQREIAPLLAKRIHLRRQLRLHPLRLLERPRQSRRERLRLLQPLRRRALACPLQQQVRRHARDDSYLRGVHGQGHRLAAPAQPLRRPRPAHRRVHRHRLPRHPRPGVSAPRHRPPLARPHLRSARLPVRRPAGLARAATHLRLAVGQALRLAQRRRRAQRPRRDGQAPPAPAARRSARRRQPRQRPRPRPTRQPNRAAEH